MKLINIIESMGGTTAGGIATVAKPLGEIETRVEKPPKSPPVKKNKKKYANQISEGAMKALAYNLKHMDADEFQKVYNKTKDFFTKSSTPAQVPKPAPSTKTGSKAWHDTGYTDKNAAKQIDEPIKEDELKEDDLIVVPGMRRMKDTSFIPHKADRRDHEVEMARSDLYAAAKDAQRIYKMIQNRTEDEGLMGWQQSYITLAADYLNSVADSLEHHAATEGAGVIAGGQVQEISDFKRREIEQELRHEKNNYAVAIDGKIWKIFPDQQQANNIARSLQRKGKKATVHLAEAKRDQYTTRFDDEGNVVKVYPPSGPKTQKAYVKSLVKNLGSSHIGKRGESPRGDKVGKGANLKGSAVAKLSGGMSKVAEEKCPHCGGELVDESLMNEKKDACYSKVKSRYKVWPSAYASGALVKCRKVGASNWGNKSKK